MPHLSNPSFTTPFKRLITHRPDLSHLRVFGSKVTVKELRNRSTKLDDDHTTTGNSLNFSATDRNIIVDDNVSHEIKTARHVTFDEAHFSGSKRPPYATHLLDIAENDLVTKMIQSQQVRQPQNKVDESNTSPVDLSSDIVHPTSHKKEVHVIPPDDNVISQFFSLRTNDDMPDFDRSCNAFGPSLDVTASLKGCHPTLGLDLYMHPDKNRIILRSCLPSSQAADIKKWRSTLRHSIFVGCNDNTFKTIEDFASFVKEKRRISASSITANFIPQGKLSTHFSTCITQLYFDQLVIMAHQHHAARNDSEPWSKPMQAPPITDSIMASAVASKHVKPRLTRKYLQAQSDWMNWKLSEFSQLNQYQAQNMFGDPVPSPLNCNVFPLIWTYMIKINGTKKSRCVCNGSPYMKGSVTLDYTYAAALEQSGARIFWSLSAISNSVGIGADATNAFAEAPPPKVPLYVTIDQPFRDWWCNVLKRPPIKVGHVLPVRHALQGYPEFPRL